MKEKITKKTLLNSNIYKYIIRYHVPINPDIKMCAYILTKEDPKGIHVNELRSKLNIPISNKGSEDFNALKQCFGQKSKA